MKQLTYFPLDSQKHVNINCKDAEDFLHFFNGQVDEMSKEKKVYLFTYNCLDSSEEGSEEIFISDNISMIAEIISNYELAFFIYEKFHLHEYRSFEDAYAVALNMREVNELCYG